jgi:regulation of enolase protein 1 (concanavalin A-like superfamily)
MRKFLLVLLIATGAFAQTRSVEVQKQRVLYWSQEYLRHAQYLEGKDGDVIAAWGWRVLQWPLDSGDAKEVVPEDPKYRFANGAVAWDINGDGNEELIAGRHLREAPKEFEVVWYERVPGRDHWIQHEIGNVPALSTDMHDMVKFVDPKSGVQSIIVSSGRIALYLFEKPNDPKQPWKRYDIMKLPDPPQSGMRVADINGDGRPDIVTGMYWLECPADPRTGEWKAHRYGDWDKRTKPWGSMNKHGVADFDGDGELEIVADEAESAGSRVALFKRDPKNPDGLWKMSLIDTDLYCPHTLEVADLNEDGRPDFVVGEMDAGGWRFPYNTKPRLIAYLNQGGGKFQKVVLAEGLGTHEGKFAPKAFQGRPMFYSNSTTQPWFSGMITNLTTWTIQPAGAPAEQSLFQDNFAGKLGEGWTWVREQPDAWKVGENGLTMRTLTGTLWGETNTAPNLLLRSAPDDGEFATEVTVAIRGALDGEQAGLIWYGDDDNYVKLVNEFKGQPFLLLAREEKGKAKEMGRIPAPDGQVVLRLVSHNGWVRAEARGAGTDAWETIGECAGLPVGESRVGVFTHVLPGLTDRSASFRNFRLLQERSLSREALVK